jgi:hypothetical protein
VSARGMSSGSGHPRIIDDNPDIQFFTGHDIRSSSLRREISHSSLGFHGEAGPEQQVDYEAGYIVKDPAAASSNGHSSHGHGTVITRNSSLTRAASTRNTSPTFTRRNTNRTRFSLSPDRNLPSAWPTSRSEVATRRRSVDDGSATPYLPHRVNSDPVIHHVPQLMMPPYPRRQSSEVPRPEMLQYLGPPIHHQPPPDGPSSLLRPQSPTQVQTFPTNPTIQQPLGVYLRLPLVSEPTPSPAASSICVLPSRQHLLATPPNPSTGSTPNFGDEFDHSRHLSDVGVSVSRPFLDRGLGPIHSLPP